MSTWVRTTIACLLVTGLALAGSGSGGGDKEGKTEEPPCRPPENGIIEGPDPIPGRCPDDDRRRDPYTRAESDLAYDPRSGHPTVVWAEDVGGDHDLALSDWQGDRWSTTRYLTFTLADDRDPRIEFDAAGDLHVAWWQSGERRVLYGRRDAVSGGWSADAAVALGGSRPALALVGGEPWIAYERAAAESGLDVVVARLAGDGRIVHELVARTARHDPLALELGQDVEGPWVTWLDAEGHKLRSRASAEGWTAPLRDP